MVAPGAITLHQFRVQLEEEASEGLVAGLHIFMEAAADELEDRVRANIEARLAQRSRALISTVRSDIEGGDREVSVQTTVGGEYQGLRVPYARIQEEGGTVLMKDKLLTIPLAPALTGPAGREQPKYPRASLAPRLEWRPIQNGTSGPGGVLIHSQTGEVWYVLTPKVTISPKHYMRDAAAEMRGELPGQLLAFVTGRLGELGGPVA